ncbi:UNVERIFIED_CONTAM: hypothetical protein Slati_1144700 [Sesamum latifolium]|uniref:Reverse transcriptase zinc-binding domain-containing protein n=1 Tax=Sesamum latifolium TaxID=2727402 RepID=A0AAW2XFK1_9LAMI
MLRLRTHMLPNVIYHIGDGQDCIKWGTGRGQFDNAVVYELFRPPGPKVGWSSLFLGPFKIPRNAFILWLAILGRLFTLDKQWLRHLDGMCILCTDGLVETHQHLFSIASMHSVAFLASGGVYDSRGLIGIGRAGLIGPLLDGEGSMWLMLRTGLYWHPWFITFDRNKTGDGSSLLRGHLLSLDIVYLRNASNILLVQNSQIRLALMLCIDCEKFHGDSTE